MNLLFRSPLVLFLTAAVAHGATHTVSFTVSAGKYDRKNEVVCVPIELASDVKAVRYATIVDGEAEELQVATGQVVAPGLAAKAFSPAAGRQRRDLYFVLPALKAGDTRVFKAKITSGDAAKTSGGFHWESGKGGPRLVFGEERRPVLRYAHPKLDESTPKTREATFKAFHELYTPDGKRLITKGVGGEFTHHRGLFYGFMKATYGKQTVDIWHCKGDTHQADRGVAAKEGGPVLGRHRVRIDWNGVGKETFAREERELTAFDVPGGTLIEFASKLTPTDLPVKLDGDPQHAGFHFRADNEVAAKNKKETIFIRPDGAGKPGTEVNWPANKKHVNLPWLGMSFVLGGQRYTVAYLDRPANPKEARFSERTYGRVGSYFVTTVTKEKPLVIVYRVWLQGGLMIPGQIAAKSHGFVEPVGVKVQ